MADRENVVFCCLRCGNEYIGPYTKGEPPKELTCPKCRSNSVRRIPPKKDAEE